MPSHRRLVAEHRGHGGGHLRVVVGGQPWPAHRQRPHHARPQCERMVAAQVDEQCVAFLADRRLSREVGTDRERTGLRIPGGQRRHSGEDGQPAPPVRGGERDGGHLRFSLDPAPVTQLGVHADGQGRHQPARRRDDTHQLPVGVGRGL